MKAQIKAAIDGLPSNERTVVLLFYMSGHSQQEIGDFLEVPITTVKKRLQAARKKLRGQLKDRVITMVQDELQEQAPSRNEHFSHSVRAAIHVVDSGDTAALQRLLAQTPDLVRAQSHLEEDYPHRYFRGATLLHYVAGNPFRHKLPSNILEIAQLLLDAGADVDARTLDGNTTLDLVITSAEANRAGVSAALIETLLKAGATLDWNDPELLALPLRNGAPQAAAELHHRGAPVDLRYAAGLGNLELVQSFFNNGGSLKPQANALRREPCSDQELMEEAFGYACMNNCINVADFLLSRGVDINARPLFWGGSTGLHNAIYWDHREMVRFLIERGADINCKHLQYQATPLDWAVYHGRIDLAELLRQHGGHE